MAGPLSDRDELPQNPVEANFRRIDRATRLLVSECSKLDKPVGILGYAGRKLASPPEFLEHCPTFAFVDSWKFLLCGDWQL